MALPFILDATRTVRTTPLRVSNAVSIRAIKASLLAIQPERAALDIVATVTDEVHQQPRWAEAERRPVHPTGLSKSERPARLTPLRRAPCDRPPQCPPATTRQRL